MVGGFGGCVVGIWVDWLIVVDGLYFVVVWVIGFYSLILWGCCCYGLWCYYVFELWFDFIEVYWIW